MEFTPVDASNEDKAIRILSQAFSDDPVMNWSCNDPASLEPFFELTLETFTPHGLTYMDSGEGGAAAWLGPGETLKWSYSFSNVRKILNLGGIKGIYRMLLSGMSTEKHHPTKPHYYLFAIGATPENRGKGIGSALIKHVLRRCDEEGMPAYLENSKQENLKFYEGHGFKVMKKIHFARLAPPVWLMWREPRSAE